MIFKLSSEEDRQAVIDYLSRLSFSKGQEFSADIKRKSTKRTSPQNALFHMWVRCIASETGNSNETVKKVLCRKFLGFDTSECMGETIGEVRHTSTLTTEQMTEFMNQVEAFASDYGIILPHPEDRYFQQFEEYYNNG